MIVHALRAKSLRKRQTIFFFKVTDHFKLVFVKLSTIYGVKESKFSFNYLKDMIIIVFKYDFFTSAGFRQYKVFTLCNVEKFVGTELELRAN